MKSKKDDPHGRLTAALQAINNLAARELNELFNNGQVAAMTAHSEIEVAPVNRKSAIFYRHLVPLRKDLVFALANSYRRCLKLALGQSREAGNHPEQWAWSLIQPAIIVTLDCIRDWYTLACDGANQSFQQKGSVPFVAGETVSISIPLDVSPFPPPQTWRAPAWLFQVSPTLGICLLRSEHVPANDSEEKLPSAHTRLLLKGARRSFMWQLDAAITTVRDEEIAASGAISAETVKVQTREPNKRKGFEQRLKLYAAIQKALSANPSLEGIELCAELDKRHAPPLSDWVQGGEWREGLTWKEAWGNLVLRRRIRRVRQEAMKRR